MSGRLTVSQFLRISVCSLAVATSLWTSPVWAGDPFRSSNPRSISDRAEATFEAIFKEGNYPKAKILLSEVDLTDSNEPLVYAIQAALAYTEQDLETLNRQAQKTVEVAQQLTSDDPLRGNLYLAVGTFLEGAYIYQQKGPLDAIANLKKVLDYIDQAEAIAPNDPELNLFKGYMELLLAVNLPFSSPELAIEEFQQNASPNYLVNRGIAIAYRDLDRYDRALEFVNRALEQTPANPELYYLKGQILYGLGKKNNRSALLQEAVENFDRALEKENQLPESLVREIRRERRLAH